jgi:tRNA threonylcarbamoyl adenosine modification protein YeaZ
MKSSKASRSKVAGPSLFIDTTVLNEITVAFVSGSDVKHITQPIGFDERDDLLRYIDRLVKRFQVPVHRISSIIVVRGPGSFTAIRVGVTVANGLGQALALPVYGIKKMDSISIADVVKKAKRTQIVSRPILPFYDRAPNITKPKRKSTKITINK